MQRIEKNFLFLCFSSWQRHTKRSRMDNFDAETVLGVPNHCTVCETIFAKRCLNFINAICIAIGETCLRAGLSNKSFCQQATVIHCLNASRIDWRIHFVSRRIFCKFSRYFIISALYFRQIFTIKFRNAKIQGEPSFKKYLSIPFRGRKFYWFQ